MNDKIHQYYYHQMCRCDPSCLLVGSFVRLFVNSVFVLSCYPSTGCNGTWALVRSTPGRWRCARLAEVAPSRAFSSFTYYS